MSIIASYINGIKNDKKDHAIFGLLANYLVIIGFLIGLSFSIKTGVIVSNVIGLFLISFYAYKEIVIDGIKGKGKKEVLDFLWNSQATIQSLLLINLVYFSL